LASNYLTKVEGTNDHGHHLTTSSIFDNGSKVSINSNTEITGTLRVTGTPLVSGSAQISHDSTTGYIANRHIDHSSVTITAGNGLSGGGTIEANRTMSLDTSSTTFTNGVKSKMNTDGVISGSSQVVAALPSGTVSGSSQVLSGTGIFSGSAQLPSGLVSGSSQVLAGTTIHSGSFFNGITVVSGSAQISFNGITDKPALVSGSAQISFNSISDKPALVSGSSQISYPSLSNIPGGIVSGSSQIDLTATTNYSSGIKTRLNAEGVISGSSQVTGIANSQLVNSSFHVGTTSISLGRASASQTLTGVSIDGNAATVTNGVYTTGDQTIGGAKTFSANITNSSAADWYMYGFGARGASSGQYGIGLTADIANRTLSFHVPNVAAYSNSGNTPKFGWYSNGADELMTLQSATGNLVVKGTISATNFSGTSSGTNTGDQTLNSLGALSNNADSEQNIGVKDLFYNDGVKRVSSDPRWNESGYDADLGTLHIYSTTAAGANYGRAGIALYNGSAYQYITTKASTTGVFVNNTQIVTNSGTWGISISGNATTATTAGSLTSMNISQFTNNSGYITSYTETDTLSSVVSRGATTTSTITINKTGTLISHAGMSDAIGYNASYGTYIGSPLGGLTYYLYANGTFNENGSIRTLLHSGNFSSYALPLAGGTMTGDLQMGNNQNRIIKFRTATAWDYSLRGVNDDFFITDNPGLNYLSLFYNGGGGNRYASLLGVLNVFNNGSSTFSGALGVGGILTVTNGSPSGATSSAGNAHLRIDSSGNQYIEFRTSAGSSGIMQGTLYTDNGRNAFIGFKEYSGAVANTYGESIHLSISDFSGSDAGSGIYLGASSDNLNGVTTPWFSIRGGTSYFYGNVLPDTNNSRNLGSPSLGWANVYTNDLHLSNMNKPEGNDIDGTSGNWTIQEGAENLYIINNNNGKKFKISLEEII